MADETSKKLGASVNQAIPQQGDTTIVSAYPQPVIPQSLIELAVCRRQNWGFGPERLLEGRCNWSLVPAYVGSFHSLHLERKRGITVVVSADFVLVADGAIGGTAQKVGGPFDKDGTIGSNFTTDGAIGGTVQKTVEKK